MPVKTNKLSIYLIKPGLAAFAQIVTADTDAYPIDGTGTFYIEKSEPHPPSWLKNFFGSALGPAALPLISSSAKGVLLVRVRHAGQRYVFAVIFGFGRHLLRDDVIEERFGLKTVLNSVDHLNLRSIDRTSLGSVPKQTREQMSREAEVADFGLDIEQDLVSSVTGKSRFTQLGRTISGRDGLNVHVKVDATTIKDFLIECLVRYLSNEYTTNFGWIDQIKQVRNSPTIDLLDGLLVAALANQQFDKIWMAPPDIIEWGDIAGFRYQQPKRGALQTDLHIEEFIDSLEGQPITVDVLRDTRVHLISAATDDAVDHWTAYKCVCAEVAHNNNVFVLNNGKWYEVLGTFAAEVKQSYDTMADCTLALPDYAHADEEAYNIAATAVIANAYCMDRKLITYGGGGSRIEFCDIATADKRLIHVKRYAGSTSLSHLFAQGTVSGELFLQDREFRKLLNTKLPAGRKLANSQLRPTASDYEIVFAIISKSAKPLDVPFFSKVTLRNARRRLEAYGYKVTKKKIQQT